MSVEKVYDLIAKVLILFSFGKMYIVDLDYVWWFPFFFFIVFSTQKECFCVGRTRKRGHMGLWSLGSSLYPTGDFTGYWTFTASCDLLFGQKTSYYDLTKILVFFFFLRPLCLYYYFILIICHSFCFFQLLVCCFRLSLEIRGLLLLQIFWMNIRRTAMRWKLLFIL